MLDLNSADSFHICANPVDMRNGRDGLPKAIREIMGHDPCDSSKAFILYSKDYRTIKIYHKATGGSEIYIRYFDNGRFLKPIFSEMKASHRISRIQLQLLLSGAVVTTIEID